LRCRADVLKWFEQKEQQKCIERRTRFDELRRWHHESWSESIPARDPRQIFFSWSQKCRFGKDEDNPEAQRPWAKSQTHDCKTIAMSKHRSLPIREQYQPRSILASSTRPESTKCKYEIANTVVNQDRKGYGILSTFSVPLFSFCEKRFGV
jgi:hypothetical protein